MPRISPTINKVLCPTDFSEGAKRAVTQAIRCAGQFEAEFHLLHAVVLPDSTPFSPSQDLPDSKAMVQAFLDESRRQMSETHLLDLLSADPGRTRRVHRRGETPGAAILEYACSEDIDLIIMATHRRRGLRRLFLGSVAGEVVRHAPCPVLTLHQDASAVDLAGSERILVPVDLSSQSRRAVASAKELAGVSGAELQLLHIAQPSYPLFAGALADVCRPSARRPSARRPSARRPSANLADEPKRALEKLVAETPGPRVKTSLHIGKGNVTEEILSFADQLSSDLIVIATHGLTGFSHLLLGSVCEKIVGRAPCPVFSLAAFAKAPAAARGQHESRKFRYLPCQTSIHTTWA